MNSNGENLRLGESAGLFLADLSPVERGSSQQEIYRFLRWFGEERPFAGLTASEVDKYAEQLSISDTDYTRKLELIRTFLAYAKKKGWSKTNLAVHLKTRKGKTGLRSSSGRGLPEAVFLTQQGHIELEAELAILRDKRSEVIDEIRRAAADKDFRENAPLEAARERAGHLEGRILELETTLKLSVIIDEQQKDTFRVGIGATVILCDLGSGEELSYTLVNPREADPVKGKISSVSPIGQAVIGRVQGEIVEVVVPAGKLRYQVKQVEA
ncbi:GreA/GreB family elongation factor [Chloroflexota bacterium]